MHNLILICVLSKMPLALKVYFKHGTKSTVVYSLLFVIRFVDGSLNKTFPNIFSSFPSFRYIVQANLVNHARAVNL